ncbi:MAG: nitroreductase family protein [Actinomycetota bacterium]
MELREAVRERRMVRNYRDEPVSRKVVERLTDLARRAPSAGFSQGQYLVVVTEQELRTRIAELAEEEHYVSLGFPPWISRAPVHVVVCTREEDYRERYREPDKIDADGSEIEWPVPYWYVDAGASLMLLLLGAVDEGLGAGFFGVHRLPGLKELLDIPTDVTPVGVVTLGHPAADQPLGSARRGRKPRAHAVRWERW